jgi:branched-chain amino acid transport system substrate-binding protein
MMASKNLIGFGMLAVIAVILAVASISGFMLASSPAEQVVRIGSIQPVSGPLAVYGTEYNRGIEMAVEIINQEGGINGKRLEVVYEDSQGNAKEGVTAANKVIQIDQVPVIMTSMSAPSLAIAPIAQSNRVVMISQTVSKVGDTGDFVFRDYWDMKDQGKALASVVNEKGYKKVGIIALNFPDYEFFMEGFREVADEDVEILEERFNFGDTDFKTQLLKIREFDPDVILTYSFPGNELINIVQQIFELGMERPMLDGATGLGWGFMTEALGDYLLDVEVIANWYSLDTDMAQTRAFIEAYEDRYGQSLNGDAAYSFDDMFALRDVMETCDLQGRLSDTGCIRDELFKTDQEGIAGDLVFDENGNSMRPWFLQTFTTEGWKQYMIASGPG